MNILIIGLNHDTAPIEIREKVAFNGPKLKEAIDAIKTFPEIKENIILSTCNRVEIYSNVNDVASGSGRIKKFIADFHSVPENMLNKSLYVHSGKSAITHVFRVASG